MATGTINSVQYDYTNDVLASGIRNRASEEHGKVRVLFADVNCTAIDAGSTLNLGWLPIGATFLYAHIAFEGTTSLTLSIGDADDPNRLVDAASLATDIPTTGGVNNIYARLESTAPDATTGSMTPTLGTGYRYTADTLITALTAGATMTAGEVIRVKIFYSVE